MRRLISLEKNNSFVYSSQMGEYLNPDYVYVAIKDNYLPIVKNGDNVLKGQTIIENNLNKVYSPISGTVMGVVKKNVNRKIENCMVIQNDFREKEKTILRKKSEKYTKDSLIGKLFEYYFKYIASTLETKKINHLIINGIDDEAYILNNSYVLKEYPNEILSMIDILSTTFEIPASTVIMKSTDTTNINTYLNKIGTYPNIGIRFVEDKYLLGKPYFLMEYFGLKEYDTLVLDVIDVVNMYYAIKYNRYPCETFITIAGESIAKSYVLKVKIGTKLSDIIENKIKVKNKDCHYILDGLMRGYEVNPEDIVISSSTMGVIVLDNIDNNEEPCSNCGLCYKVCPVKINPKNCMDKNKQSINCLDCGLCSYICPSHINLRKFLSGKDE